MSLALQQSPHEVEVQVLSKTVLNLNVSHAVLQNVLGALIACVRDGRGSGVTATASMVVWVQKAEIFRDIAEIYIDIAAI